MLLALRHLRSIFMGGFFLLSLGLAERAWADEGDLGLGLHLAATYPLGMRAELGLTHGVNDWVAVDLSGGIEFNETSPRGLLAAQLVGLFDVFSVVPKLSFGIGAQFNDIHMDARLIGQGGVIWHLSPNWSLDIGLRGEWHSNNTAVGALYLGGMWYLLD